jgi:hypothetical protein
MSEENKTQKLVNYVSRLSANVSAEKAIEVYKKEIEQERKRCADSRYKNTKLLLKQYRNLKGYAKNAVCNSTELETILLHEVMGYDKSEVYKVKSIRNQLATTQVILQHVEIMLELYKSRCNASEKDEIKRRWRVIDKLYISNDEAMSVEHIAEIECIDTRTVYKDIDKACKELTSLFFGLNFNEFTV